MVSTIPRVRLCVTRTGKWRHYKCHNLCDSFRSQAQSLRLQFADACTIHPNTAEAAKRKHCSAAAAVKQTAENTCCCCCCRQRQVLYRFCTETKQHVGYNNQSAMLSLYARDHCKTRFMSCCTRLLILLWCDCFAMSATAASEV